jgi:hypothetical protein
MANYTKLTDFASKDTLPSGNAAKIVKGTEIDDELAAIETAIASKANSDSPALTGTPTAPTATSGTNTTQIATTAFVQNEVTTALTDMTSIDLGDWAITVSGTELIFAYNSTDVFKLASTGAVTSADNITAYGTV